MNKVKLFAFLIIIFSANVFAQKVSLDTLGTLAPKLKEISGMVHSKKGVIWAINDSGNEPILFQINAKGEIVREVFVTNANNVDWEELAMDLEGFIYIGDFGNNRNDRKDLVIYKVKEEMLFKSDSVLAERINFVYPDQKGFPPESAHLNFDMEAMVCYTNQLVLFSKNRTEPFSGYTYVYKLPNYAGNFVAEKVDSLKLGNGPRELFQVTAADMSPSGKTLALLSYDKFFLIHDFPYNDLIGGRIEEVEFKELSQKESIAWLGDSTVLISDEKSVLGGGFLYELSLRDELKRNNEVRKKEVLIPIKEFRDSLQVNFETEVRGKVYFEFFDGEGQRVHTGVVGYFDRGAHSFWIVPSQFLNGTYMLNVQIGTRPHAFFVYRFNEVDWQEVKAEFEKRERELRKGQTKAQKK